MGIEGGSNNNEIQLQEINQANNEQIEQNNAEHQRSGEQLEANSIIDNEGERKDEATEDLSNNEANELDGQDNIEQSEQGEESQREVESTQNVQSELAQEQVIDNPEQDNQSLEEDDDLDIKSELDLNSEIADSANDVNDDDEQQEDNKENDLDSDNEIENNESDDSEKQDANENTLDNNSSIKEDKSEDDNSEDNLEDKSEDKNLEEGEESQREVESTQNVQSELAQEQVIDNPEQDNQSLEEDSDLDIKSELDLNSEIADSANDINDDDEQQEDNKENDLDSDNKIENNESDDSEKQDANENTLDNNSSIKEDKSEDDNSEDNLEDKSEDKNPEEENSGDKSEDDNSEDKPEDKSQDENLEDKPEDFATKDINNKREDDNNERSSEISSNLKKSLEPIEQENWNLLKPEQQKEAINNLRDSVANDLNLQNKPEVKFYNSKDDTDFGEYSPSENAIYINEHNMGDAAKTADTIAHESRHCWQHERAENPQNEQDLAFKENFDDYVTPEDDYRGYKKQPVEADAREYASDIASNIPKQPSSSNGVISNEVGGNSTGDEIKKDTEEKGALFDEIVMPSDINNKASEPFESKIKESETYNPKFEHDIQQKLEDYFKNNEGKLSKQDKQDLVSDLKQLYDVAAKDDRGNVLVPKNAKDVISVYYDEDTGKYEVIYDWKLVDTVPGTRRMEVLKEGQQFDRVGPPTGRCTGAVDENGKCATIEQRSIPYHFTENDITKEPSYHRYKAVQDFTKENLSNAIDNSTFNFDKKQAMHDEIDLYYKISEINGYGYGDGLATGKIAPMFEDTTGATGGGRQYDMPLSMNELEEIDMINEIPKNEY